MRAQVRTRCGRWLSPLSSRKIIVRPSARAFFKGRPAHFLPVPDRRLVPLPRPPLRSLATPAEPHQNPPDMARMVVNSKLSLDQIGHSSAGPQRRFVAQRFRPLHKASLQPPPVLPTQARLPSGPARLPQTLPPLLRVRFRPAAHRPVAGLYPPRDLGLMHPLSQQPDAFHPPLLQRLEISSHSCWVSHAGRNPAY